MSAVHITVVDPAGNGTAKQPHHIHCYGKCGRSLPVPPSPDYEGKIIICRSCWQTLYATLQHLVRVVDED